MRIFLTLLTLISAVCVHADVVPDYEALKAESNKNIALSKKTIVLKKLIRRLTERGTAAADRAGLDLQKLEWAFAGKKAYLNSPEAVCRLELASKTAYGSDCGLLMGLLGGIAYVSQSCKVDAPEADRWDCVARSRVQ